MTALQWLRLLILCAYAVTMGVCFIRAARTKDEAARPGNVAMGWIALILWLAQIPYWHAPMTWLTWLTAVGVVPCAWYVVVLTRRGL